MSGGNDQDVTADLPSAIEEPTLLASLEEERLERIPTRRRSFPASLHELREHLGRLMRYAVTSGVALGISEATLLVLYATRTFGATTAAVVANLVGTLPSYLLSRYWIWKQADRRRVGRQLVLYWAISIISMVITSLATGAITEAAPAGHRAHVLVAGLGFLAISVILWVTKYIAYQKVVFRNRNATTTV